MKISESVYLLDSTAGSYVYVVVGSETALIDTGLPWKGKSIMKELGSMGIQLGNIKHILLTHHDIDHIGNVFMLQQLTGAQVWASKEDIPYITGELDRYGFKKYLKYFFKVKKPKDINPYKPEQKINGIDVIPTPGHTPGHVCLLYDDILFAGDLLENKKGKLIPYPPPWNWDDSMMLESITKISQTPYKLVCPAHGKPIQRY
ncbi:MAG TPA: MBL fold metallo-hydrolase [Clostridia bacterium]|nr:MBL fold metallo-hydrolase [Clostridia bacterium]